MARIRTVKPDYWGDPKTARLTLPARLLFIGLLTEADDEGRFLASGKKLAGSLFPNDDDVTPKKVSTWLCELEHVGFVHRYTSEGVEYAHIPAFTTHQKISHPAKSKLPGPDGGPPEPLPNPSGNPPEFLCPEQGTGNREQGMEQGSELALAVVEPALTVRDVFDFWRSATGHQRANFDDVRKRRIEWAIKNYPPDDIRDAILGAASSEFHQGRNDSGAIHDDIELICRNAVKFERFRDGFRNGPVKRTPKSWGALERLAQEGRI